MTDWRTEKDPESCCLLVGSVTNVTFNWQRRGGWEKGAATTPNKIKARNKRAGRVTNQPAAAPSTPPPPHRHHHQQQEELEELEEEEKPHELNNRTKARYNSVTSKRKVFLRNFENSILRLHWASPESNRVASSRRPRKSFTNKTAHVSS